MRIAYMRVLSMRISQSSQTHTEGRCTPKGGSGKTKVSLATNCLDQIVASGMKRRALDRYVPWLSECGVSIVHPRWR